MGAFKRMADLPKMANTAEYVELYNEAADNDNAGVTNPALIRPKIPDGISYGKYRLAKSNFSKGSKFKAINYP